MNGAAFWDILAFAGTAGVIAAVTTQAFLMYRDWRTGRKAAAALAIRCAAILETYAHECLDCAAEIDAQTHQNFDPSRISIGTPVLPKFPNEAEGWIAISKKLSGQLINLRLAAADRTRGLTFNASYQSPDDTASEYRDANIMLASDAWFVASELRRKFKFPEYGKIDARDPETSTAYYLEHAVNDIEVRRLIQEKQQADIVKELSS